MTRYDPFQYRQDFPILRQTMNGKPLVYLDNAATTQKPQCVIDSQTEFYTSQNANIHRSNYALAETATRRYEEARILIQRFLCAADPHEIVYTRNATEGVNLIAQTFGRQRVGPGDEILVTEMEHHCNIVPWQLLCAEKGAFLRYVPITDAGELRLDEYRKMLNPRVKLAGFTQMSNVLGTVNPVREMIALAKEHGIPTLVDAAQSAYHMPIDVQDLDCDFLVFSGHKLYGPTGIGVLYAKTKWLETIPPYQGGGDMITVVTFEGSEFNDPPYKFEAGTPNIAGAIGLGAAIEYLNAIGMETIAQGEGELMRYATERLLDVPGLRLIGSAPHKASVLSFVIDGIHPGDIGTVLDQEGIAVRVGQHCAHPVLQRLGYTSTVRASLGLYNTSDEIDALVRGLAVARELLS